QMESGCHLLNRPERRGKACCTSVCRSVCFLLSKATGVTVDNCFEPLVVCPGQIKNCLHIRQINCFNGPLYPSGRSGVIFMRLFLSSFCFLHTREISCGLVVIEAVGLLFLSSVPDLPRPVIHALPGLY